MRCWRCEVQRRLRPGIETVGELLEVRLIVARHRLSLRELLAQQTVGVLAGVALPGILGGGEVDIHPVASSRPAWPVISLTWS